MLENEKVIEVIKKKTLQNALNWEEKNPSSSDRFFKTHYIFPKRQKDINLGKPIVDFIVLKLYKDKLKLQSVDNQNYIIEKEEKLNELWKLLNNINKPDWISSFAKNID